MNYLAHFHLAWPEESLVVGGLEGDFHKGPLPGKLAPSLHDGVALHRAIDAYTDSHPCVAEARRRFPAELRRYAGILIDLCFDHFLTQHWSSFSKLSRLEFNAEVYAMLGRHSDLLSQPARHMAERLQEFDVLMRYEHFDTIIGSAERIGQRFKHSNPMHRSGELLPALLPELEQTFLVFYPELIGFSRRSAMLADPE
ncbi:MAG: ACP phosphodiesterase [Halieaceae bacterium]